MAATITHATHYPGNSLRPALDDQPSPLTSGKNQIMLSVSCISTAKITNTAIVPEGANPNLFTWLYKRLVALWTLAVSYCLAGAPPQGGDKANNTMMHMIYP